METKKVGNEDIIVEPVSDASMFGMMDPSIIEETDPPSEVLSPEVVGKFLGASSAPTTRHFTELSDEMIYNNYRAMSLLYKLFKYTFFYGTGVRTQLRVPGVWEVGETATYEVTVRNRNYFDLASLRVYLSVKTLTGHAEIIGPASQPIGNLAHNSSNTVSFTVKAKRTGTVMLSVVVEGLIGPCKQTFSYNGRYRNGNGGYRSDYRSQYSIY